MNTVGIRELKNRLSEYIRHVKAGETIFVTDHGQVVAELHPHAVQAQEDSVERRIKRLADEGRLIRAQEPMDGTFIERLGKSKGGAPPGAAQRYLDEGREESF